MQLQASFAATAESLNNAVSFCHANILRCLLHALCTGSIATAKLASYVHTLYIEVFGTVCVYLWLDVEPAELSLLCKYPLFLSPVLYC